MKERHIPHGGMDGVKHIKERGISGLDVDQNDMQFKFFLANIAADAIHGRS